MCPASEPPITEVAQSSTQISVALNPAFLEFCNHRICHHPIISDKLLQSTPERLPSEASHAQYADHPRAERYGVRRTMSAWLYRVNLHTDDTGILAGLILISSAVAAAIPPHGCWPAALGNRSKRDRIRVLSLRPDRRQAHPSGADSFFVSASLASEQPSLCA